MTTRLRNHTEPPSEPTQAPTSPRPLSTLQANLSRLLSVIEALKELVSYHHSELTPSEHQFLDEFRGYLTESETLRDGLAAMAQSIEDRTFAFALDSTPKLLLTWNVQLTVALGESKLFDDVSSLVRSIEHTLLIRSSTPSVFNAPCRAMSAWLSQYPEATKTPPLRSKVSYSRSDSVIQALLVSAQGLLSWTEQLSAPDDNLDLLRNKSRNIVAVLKHLNLPRIQFKVQEYLEKIQLDPSTEDRRQSLVELYVFLEEYLHLAHDILCDLASWTKSTMKLAWICCDLVHNLAKNGLCKPPDAESDSSASKGESGQTLEGSGMGSGSGDQNVTKEIEDESQVEGLQGEEENAPAPKNDDGSEEDDALEMQDDFEGDLQDGPEADEGEDNEEGEDDASDVDEQMGDLDPNDETAVDEKLWSGEKNDESAGKDDADPTKSEPDQKSSDEIAAKERESQPKDSQQQDTDETAEPQDTEGDNDDGNLPDDGPNPELGKKLDDSVQDTGALNLPDEMDLDLDADAEADAGADSGDEAGEDVDEDEIMDDGDANVDEHHSDADDSASATEDAPAGGEVTVPEEDSTADPDVSQGEVNDTPDAPEREQDPSTITQKDEQAGSKGEGLHQDGQSHGEQASEGAVKEASDQEPKEQRDIQDRDTVDSLLQPKESNQRYESSSFKLTFPLIPPLLEILQTIVVAWESLDHPQQTPQLSKIPQRLLPLSPLQEVWGTLSSRFDGGSKKLQIKLISRTSRTARGHRPKATTIPLWNMLRRRPMMICRLWVLSERAKR